MANQVGLVVASRKSLRAPFPDSEIEIFDDFDKISGISKNSQGKSLKAKKLLDSSHKNILTSVKTELAKRIKKEVFRGGDDCAPHGTVLNSFGPYFR